MKQIPKPTYRTRAEIIARLKELEQQQKRLCCGSDWPRDRPRRAQLRAGSVANPSFNPYGQKTLH